MIRIDWLYGSNFICEARPTEKMLRYELGVSRVLFFHEILGWAQKKIWRPILRPFEAILSCKSLVKGFVKIARSNWWRFRLGEVYLKCSTNFFLMSAVYCVYSRDRSGFSFWLSGSTR